MPQQILTLSVPTIFSWEAILGYLTREKHEIMYKVIEDKVRRTFFIDNQIYLCEIAYIEPKKQLQISVLNRQNWSTSSQEYIAQFVSDWFDLDTSLVAFYELASTDSILSNRIKEFYGLRMVGMPDFYEAITWGILGQQINLAYAYTLKKRFTETFGQAVSFKSEDYWIYPDPKKVAQTTIEKLVSLGMTVRKAEYLIDISQKIADGNISKSYYQTFASAEKAEKAMVKLRGIGPWTANYVLMRCLRMGDAFPMADIGLLNGIKTIKQLPEKPSPDTLLQLKQEWGNWASYATFYIWRLIY
ncbi:TPA: DNA-3-methyladenine glycosylase, partial [Streptococcus suis]